MHPAVQVVDQATRGQTTKEIVLLPSTDTWQHRHVNLEQKTCMQVMHCTCVCKPADAHCYKHACTLDILLGSSPLQVPFSSTFREFEHTFSHANL